MNKRSKIMVVEITYDPAQYEEIVTTRGNLWYEMKDGKPVRELTDQELFNLAAYGKIQKSDEVAKC